jgi:phage replication-related protein YjqB (UPF0714/DUF867 family)
MNRLFFQFITVAWFFGVIFCLALSNSANAVIIDTYQNYKELSAHERGTTGCGKDLSPGTKKNYDYSIEAITRKDAKISVFAIHAGTLEQGTGELAEAVAATDSNLYVFEILVPQNPTRLHLTSDHFDEPQALAMAAKSEQAVSLHGYADSSDEMMIGVGGGSTELKAKFLASKPVDGVAVVEFTERLTGLSKENIVNRCSRHGLQLEMSPALRNKIKADPIFRHSMAQWIRSVLTLPALR